MTSLQLTYGGVLLAVFANQICLPVPSVVFLIAAGALSAHGRMSASIVVFLGVLGCLAGDGIGFWLGRKWGSKAMRLVCRFSPDPRSSSKNAREKFHRYGPSVLCVSKFIPGLDAVMPPLSGAEGVSLLGFLALDAVGSLLWSGSYGAAAQQSAACNATHTVEARLARWLLRGRDLQGSDDFQLTQEFIAEMMGVRRTSVSVVANTLQQAGLSPVQPGAHSHPQPGRAAGERLRMLPDRQGAIRAAAGPLGLTASIAIS